MDRNFIAIKKEFTTKAKCKSLIKTLDKNLEIDKSNLDLNYSYKDIKIKSVQKFIVDKAVSFVKLYTSVYPELNMTSDRWAMTELRFKKFKPGKSFNKWHSEHCNKYPSRVLAFQLYLSDHNCGTQFMNGEYVESDIGKAVLFPAYFTHTHRGQACPQKKTRYLITGYFNFI
jgi:hypothetical protein|tara:strand:+ start:5050 stop:5565 length:516 start_codon:yes stop_codon:yes gene_type:complete